MDLPQHDIVDENAAQMMVQMKIFCFANILQENANANVMHAMQMFELILMDVQKFIAVFLFKKHIILFNLEFE